MAGGEILHHLVFHRNQVAADRPIIRPHGDSLGRGLQGRPAREVLKRIVTEQAEVRHVGARSKRWRNIARPADDAGGRDGVHGREACGLKVRLAAEALLRLVSASVRNDDCVFHRR